MRRVPMRRLQSGSFAVILLLITVSVAAGCGVAPTATPILATATVTAVDVPPAVVVAEASPTLIPTSAPSSTPLPPTATATATVPPTVTSTPTMPPTATKLPPTATPTLAPPTATLVRSKPSPTALVVWATATRSVSVATAPAPTTTPIAAPTSTVVASLTDILRPSLPTPPAAAGPNALDLAMLPLQSASDGNLWLVHTTGTRNLKPLYNHFIDLYRLDGASWAEVSRAELQCPDYLNNGSVKQVAVAPGEIWIQVDGGAGAHSGCFDLYRLDGGSLRHEVANTNAFSGNGRVQDLDGDGVGDIVLDLSDAYVFCYACGVRFADFKVLRWDGDGLAEVRLASLPETAPANLRQLNNRAVTLAEGGLWKDAQATIAQAVALKSNNPTVAWNAALINLTAGAQAENIKSSYPLLGYVFSGDYSGVAGLMRPYSPQQLFAHPSALVTGTVALDWEQSLSQWISRAATHALAVQPDLAEAYFVRGWAANLTQPGCDTAIADINKAAELKPNDALFTDSAAYLAQNQ